MFSHTLAEMSYYNPNSSIVEKFPSYFLMALLRTLICLTPIQSI